MEYKTLEERLARLHMITEEGMGAFRAKLRLLRDLGIPAVARVGKGARASFNKTDLAEVHLALTMSRFGLPPSRVVEIIQLIRAVATENVWPPRTDTRQWLMVRAPAHIGMPSEIDQIAFFSDENLVKELRYSSSNLKWFAVLALDGFAREIAVNDDDSD